MSGYPQVNGSEQPEPSLRRAGRGEEAEGRLPGARSQVFASNVNAVGPGFLALVSSPEEGVSWHVRAPACVPTPSPPRWPLMSLFASRRSSRRYPYRKRCRSGKR